MAFGVVLFTLVVQSMTMKPLLRRLGIAVRDPIQVEYEMRHARMLAFRAAALHLDEMQREGFLSEHAWEVLRPELLARVDQLALDVRALQGAHPELATKELDTARRELLRLLSAARCWAFNAMGLSLKRSSRTSLPRSMPGWTSNTRRRKRCPPSSCTLERHRRKRRPRAPDPDSTKIPITSGATPRSGRCCSCRSTASGRHRLFGRLPHSRLSHGL